MSVRFSGSGQSYSRAAALGTQSQFSLSMWLKISTDRNSVSTPWFIYNSFDYYTVQTDTDGTTMGVFDDAGLGPTRALTAGTWYYFGVSANGTSGTMVTRAAGDSSFTVNTYSGLSSGTNINTFLLGTDFGLFGDNYFNGCLAAVKWWVGATLTSDELANEAWTYMPVQTTNLKAWYPFDKASTVDHSGNGQTLSGGSGTATEDGPPIAWRRGRARVWHPTSVPQEATPGAIDAPWTMPAAAISLGANAAPGAISAPWSMPAADVFTGDPVTQAEPNVINAPWSMPAPALSVSVTVSPAAISAPWSMPSPNVSVPVAPGDGITQAGQAEWNGFLLGAATPYTWKRVDGWYTEKPPIDSGNVPQPNRHGSYSGRKQSQERIVTFTGQVKASRDDMEQVVENLILATPILDDDTELPLAIRALNKIYFGYGSVIRAAIPIDPNFKLGLGELVIQWVLSDPLLLSRELATAVIADGATQTLTNLGNASTYPLIRCPGPAVQPMVIIERLSGSEVIDTRVLEFDVTIASGHRLIIDPYYGTAAIDGTDDVMESLAGGSTSVTDWVLAAGQSDVTYATTAGTAPAATVLWRHAIL